MTGKKRSSRSLAIASLLLLLLLIVLSIGMGKYQLSPGQVIQVLLSPIRGLSDSISEMDQRVVFFVRLPRVLAAVLIGAALALSGATYQSLFNNPLVSPDILGVSSGAALGAAVGILLSFHAVGISALAFVVGAVAVFLSIQMARVIGNRSNLSLVLSGIIVGSLMNSLFGFMKYIADPFTELPSITYWTMGSLSYVRWNELLILTVTVIACSIVLYRLSWWLNIASLGSEQAQILGADIGKIRGLAIIAASLLTATSVAVAGNIGWIGLVVPHLSRLMVGPNNRKLIPQTFLLGSIFLLLVDTLTRIISFEEMPLSILTGIVGAPFYAYLLYKQRRTVL